MTIRVLYFAALKDFTGTDAETVEIDAGADVAGLWESLKSRHPRLSEVTFRPMTACDMAYSPWDRPLAGVAEVAFLPPVSGG